MEANCGPHAAPLLLSGDVGSPSGGKDKTHASHGWIEGDELSVAASIPGRRCSSDAFPASTKNIEATSKGATVTCLQCLDPIGALGRGTGPERLITLEALAGFA